MMTSKQLAARDGLNCGLCHRPVSFSHAFPHPLSATVGHIIPRDRGGDDAPENLRLEHWNCNQGKATYLDGELDPTTLVPPTPVLDIVAVEAAIANHRAGARNGGLKNKGRKGSWNKGKTSHMKGKKHTDETRQKISEAQRGEKKPNFRKHHTDETRQKISESNRGKTPWNKRKKE